MSIVVRVLALATVALVLSPVKANNCGAGEFFFGGKGCCLSHGGPPSPPSPPQGLSCPPTWYWHSTYSCCVPSSPPPPSPPTCGGNNIWDSQNFCCKPPPQPTCPGGQFWFDNKQCCLPHGGIPSPPSCPSGKSCPPSWYWHPDHSCCVPTSPPPPTPPTCPPTWIWEPDYCWCNHGPQPSGGQKKEEHRRSQMHHARADLALCPTGMEACPVPGLFGGEYECLDTKSELESCGGCASIGLGEDCSAIQGAWSVGCKAGKCVVYTCARGYVLSAFEDRCVPLKP